MKTLMRGIRLIVVLAAPLYVWGCGGGGGSPDDLVNGGVTNSGSWYVTGFRWPHDGNPLASENFVIYSDAASPEARQQLAQICEDAFVTIKARLGIIDSSILQFPANRNDKIHIYAYKNYFPQEWGGQAYYGGYMIYSPDHPQRMGTGNTSLDSYMQVVRHEMMHVVQTLILGVLDEKLLYSWFAEGIAIEISDDTFYEKIVSQAQFDELVSAYGALNPISLQYSWTYPDIQGVETFYYYPMFGLAVRYLLDPNGQGGSFQDVRDVLIDVSNGINFGTSLANRFGISLAEYEDQFFSIMDDYLN